MNKKFAGLNLLKFISSLIIASYHFGMLPCKTNFIPLKQVFGCGGLFVEVFFIMSGFLIENTYYNKIEKMSFKNFMLKRIIKLWPTIFISTIFGFIVAWLSYFFFKKAAFGGGTNFTLSSLIFSVFSLHCGLFCNHDKYIVNGPTWYISVLIICYVIYYIVKKQGKFNKQFICFLVMLFGIYLTTENIAFPLLYPSCGRGYLNFFMGVLVSMNFDKIKNLYTEKKSKFVVLIQILLVLLYAIALKFNKTGFGISWTLFVALPMVLLFALNQVVDKFCDNKFVSCLGKLSMYIFLFNVPFIGLVKFISLFFVREYDYIGLYPLLLMLNIFIGYIAMKVDDKIQVYIKSKSFFEKANS